MSEKDDAECFVCTEGPSEGRPLLSHLCLCVDRHVHQDCQQKLVETCERTGACSVCQQKYCNIVVRVDRRRNYTRDVALIFVRITAFIGTGSIVFITMQLIRRIHASQFFCFSTLARQWDWRESNITNTSTHCASTTDIFQVHSLESYVLFVASVTLCLNAALKQGRRAQAMPEHIETREIVFT